MSYYNVNAVACAKNENVLREMYGTKVAKKIRKTFNRIWEGKATTEEINRAIKEAKEALEARKVA